MSTLGDLGKLLEQIPIWKGIMEFCMLKSVLLLTLFSLLAFGSAITEAASAKCPVINGTFELVKQNPDATSVIISTTRFTRVERGVFSYTIDKQRNFQVADGTAKPIRVGDNPGKIRLTCIDGSLKSEVWADRFEERTLVRHVYTMIDSNRMKRESSLSHLDGIYSRRDQARSK